MRVQRSKLLVVGTVFLLVGCGSSSPTDGGDPPGSMREIKANPSFANDINEIFQRRGCASGFCHGAAGGQAGLMLTASAASNYAELFDVDAQSEAFKRVLPGNANDSYLVIKLEGRQTVGVRMPRNGAPLDNIDLTNIKNWINNGAPNN